MAWRDADVEKIVHCGALLKRRVKALKGKARQGKARRRQG